jgi:2'-5' RNA ligase
METKYSIAFIPNDEIIHQVKTIKMELAEKIGWFHSKNALAHITICEFTVDSSSIARIKNIITRIVSTFSSIEVRLNTFRNYPNGVFFIAPDEHSKNCLKNIMKTVSSSLKIKNIYKSSDPHLSIARKLNAEQLEIAINLFQKTDIYFTCGAIFLRQFNPELKQFVIVDTFLFKSKTTQVGVQASLF